jgi:hypothetical protein
MRFQVRIAVALALAAMGAGFAASAQAADATSALVVPGRPGVPVMWFGRDISGAVIEGDRGLDRPGSDHITIIPVGPPVWWGPGPGGYYPSTGHAPRYGREEVEPPANRRLPPPAESYYREWGAQSEPAPATSPPPSDQPPIYIAPQINQQLPNQRPSRRPVRPAS